MYDFWDKRFWKNYINKMIYEGERKLYALMYGTSCIIMCKLLKLNVEKLKYGFAL